MRSALALWLAAAAVLLALAPAGWAVMRENWRRRTMRLALERVVQARAAVGGRAPSDDESALARGLTQRFDTMTLERAVLALLRSADEVERAWGRRLFADLAMLDRYAKRLAGGRRWSERTHAAEVLGLAALPAAIPALAAALRDRHEDDGSVKNAAAAALAKLREPAAIPLLADELRDSDDLSSSAVAEALAAFGSAAVPALLALLTDGTRPPARTWAARLLGRIRDPSAVDALVGRLHDRDERLRMAAAEALGAIAERRALQPVIRAALRDPAAAVRAHAAAAVASIEGEGALGVLVAALADPDHATRLRALEALESLRIADTSPLEAALRDPNQDVRRRAALALQRVGYLEGIIARLTSEGGGEGPHAYAALLEMGQAGLAATVASYVTHPAFEVRALAARACGELGATQAGPALLGVIEDSAWPVRAAACIALGRLRRDDALEPIVGALQDPEEVVREAAAEALSTYPPERLEAHLDALAAAYDAGTVAVRTSVIDVAGRVGGLRAEALLERACTDPSDAVRLAAVTALGQAREEPRLEPLVERLTDASLRVRMAAVTALGSIGRTEAFEGLVGALPGAGPSVRDRIAESLAARARGWVFDHLADLERSSADVKLGVAWTLGKTGEVAAAAPLARFLGERDPALRASAAGALAKIDDPVARAALVGAIDDPDARVRAAVVNALGRAGGDDPQAIRGVERRASDPDPFVRNRALIALARLGGSATSPSEREARVRAHASSADPSARVVALTLVGTESSLTSAIEGLSAAGGLPAVVRFLGREQPAVRDAFFRALHLREVAPGEPTDEHELAEQYEERLRSSLDVDARRLAAIALDRLGDARAVPALADALAADPEAAVRQRAAAALYRYVSDDVARRALLRAVADPDEETAALAIRAVATRPDPTVRAALQARLGDGSPRIAEAVEVCLAELYRADPTALVDWMMGADVPERLAPAVRVLARIAHPSTLPLLRELVRSRSSQVRSASIAAIAAIDPDPAAALVEGLADDPSEEVRHAAIAALRWTPRTLDRCRRLCLDPSASVRAHAARALGASPGLPADAARAALESMVGDAAVVVRGAALASLVALGDLAALRAFAEHLGQASVETRQELRRDPRGASLASTLAGRFSSTTNPDERRCAVLALAAFAPPDLAKWVAPALHDPSPQVRVAALQALWPTGDAGVRAQVADLCTDPEPSVRDAAQLFLGSHA